MHVLALILAARDIGAADSGRALAVGFVIRIVLGVLRVAVVAVLDSLVRGGFLFLLASDVQRTGRVIMTWILGLLAVLLISGLLESAVVKAGLIVMCLRLVREVLALSRGQVRSLVGFVLVMLRLYVILQLFAQVLESADQLLGVVVDRLDISVAGRRIGFAPRLVEFVLVVALRLSLVFCLGVFIRVIVRKRAGDRLVLQGGSIAVEGGQVYVPAIFDVVLTHVLLFDHLDQLHIVNIAVAPVGHLARLHWIAPFFCHPGIVLIFGNDAGDLSLLQRIVSLVAGDRLVLHRFVLGAFAIPVHNLFVLDALLVGVQFPLVPPVVIWLVRNFGGRYIPQPLDEEVVLSRLQEEFENHRDHAGGTRSVGRVDGGERLSLPVRHRPLHLLDDQLLLNGRQALELSSALVRNFVEDLNENLVLLHEVAPTPAGRKRPAVGPERLFLVILNFIVPQRTIGCVDPFLVLLVIQISETRLSQLLAIAPVVVGRWNGLNARISFRRLVSEPTSKWHFVIDHLRALLQRVVLHIESARTDLLVL